MIREAGAKPVVLFVTYTMRVPPVGGAFFRALRLALEFARRGWAPVICNNGPMLSDPKIDRAGDQVPIVALDREAPGLDAALARDTFLSFDPAVIVFGEGPFEVMRVFYDGARRTGRPLVVLDQYYNDQLVPDTAGVDLLLLYGLRAFWQDRPRLGPGVELVPPFIEAVTPPAELPVPEALRDRPWLTVVAYQDEILARGIELAARPEARGANVLTLSRAPDEARRLLDRAGIAPERSLALPPQDDATLFGLLGASRVAVISNGFLQIMDTLALACPVICLPRGVGITAYNVDDIFRRYVSIDEGPWRQRRRLADWLRRSPFPPALRAALATERGGARRSADRIESLVVRPVEVRAERQVAWR
jgi:hypothetical protein